jgi:hypothetical protein
MPRPATTWRPCEASARRVQRGWVNPQSAVFATARRSAGAHRHRGNVQEIVEGIRLSFVPDPAAEAGRDAHLPGRHSGDSGPEIAQKSMPPMPGIPPARVELFRLCRPRRPRWCGTARRSSGVAQRRGVTMAGSAQSGPVADRRGRGRRDNMGGVLGDSVRRALRVSSGQQPEPAARDRAALQPRDVTRARGAPAASPRRICGIARPDRAVTATSTPMPRLWPEPGDLWSADGTVSAAIGVADMHAAP